MLGLRSTSHTDAMAVTEMTDGDVADALGRVRGICLGLPGTSEKVSHGAPTFFVKKVFVTFYDDHHGDGRVAIWCPAPQGAQALMVESEPERFFVPPYVGHRGWLGLRLDVDPDWEEVRAVIEEGWRTIAPKKLLAELDSDN
jgi:hypothetical protein